MMKEGDGNAERILSMPRTYALIFGITYVIIAVIEFLFREAVFGLLHFTPLHASIHALAGAVLLLARYKGEAPSLLATRTVGPFFLILFLMGIGAPALLSDMLGYPVNWLYNLAHLLTGVSGIYVGFLPRAAKSPVATPPAPQPPSSSGPSI